MPPTRRRTTKPVKRPEAKKQVTPTADVLRPTQRKQATTTRPVSTADVLRPVKKPTPRHMYDMGGNEYKFPKMYMGTDDDVHPNRRTPGLQSTATPTSTRTAPTAVLPTAKRTGPTTTDRARDAQRGVVRYEDGSTSRTEPYPTTRQYDQNYQGQDVPKPPLDILPEVGPVGTMRSRAVRTYNISPEGYRGMRQVPTRLEPYEGQPHGGLYSPSKNTIDVVGDARAVDTDEFFPRTMAHEGAHAFYFNRGDNRQDVQNAFRTDFNRWRDEAGPGSVPDRSYGIVEDNPELYGYTPMTELHAYSVGENPGQREPIPDYMQGWYHGYLRDMQPRRPNQINRMDSELYPGEVPYYMRKPDENGNYGSIPQRNWR